MTPKATIKEAESPEARMARVCCAFREAHSEELEPPRVMNVFPEYLIARRRLRAFRVPYTMTDSGTVAFGESQPVTVEYVLVSEAQAELVRNAPVAFGTAPRGDAWEVRVIKAGYSKSVKPVPGTGKEGRWLYTDEAIKSAPNVFEGAAVYAFEAKPEQWIHLWGLGAEEKTKRGLVQNLIGYLEHVKEDNGQVVARLSLLKDGATAVVKAKLLDLYQRGRQDLVGLSIDARVYGVPIETSEGLTFAVLEFARPATVDVATHPAAGGAFLRALEAVPEKEAPMVKELLAKLRARRPDLAAALGDTPTEAQAQEALLAALDTLEPASGSDRSKASDAREALEESRKLRCELTLDKKLADAKLPPPVAQKLRKRYEGTVFDAATLEADITAEKETLDALAPGGHVHDLGTPRAEVVLEHGEKLQIAMDRMFGASAKEATAAHKGIPAFKGFRHAFKVITGRDLEDMLNHRIATAQEAILAASWPNILGTSMHRRLIRDYLAPAYGEDRIVTVRPGGVNNFKTQESLRVKYFADLADVDPETADYTEIAEPGDEKVSWAVIQKGNILTITRKTLLNDDLGTTTRLVGRLGRSARRTKAKFVWNFWINNSVYDVDATAWFHASHGNLQSTALTADQSGAAEVLAALTRLGKMTEPGSGERLGLPELRSLQVWLVVPLDLLGVAHQVNASQTLPNTGNVQIPNPIYQLFGANDERIIVNPLLTDATDWGIFRDPSEVDSIEMGFLNDQQEPEFFVASVPTIGQMFVADKQQYKIRHEYGGDILDFRGAVKAVVAG